MKRNRHPRRTRQTPDTELLLRLASRLGQSSNRIEDVWWEARLAAHVDHLLADGAEEALVTVLDQLYSSGSRDYDELADKVEAWAETRRAESARGHEGGVNDKAQRLCYEGHAPGAAAVLPRGRAVLRPEVFGCCSIG